MPRCAPRVSIPAVAVRVLIPALLFAAGACAAAPTVDYELSGRLGIESRWYPESAAHPRQRSHASGFVVEPHLHVEDEEGRSLTLKAFLRQDAADSRRAHADVREAYVLLFGEVGDDEWELRLGIDRVFWGVTESHHLVDIVNQTDLVEHPNREAKLGQPMVHWAWSGDFGVAELFALPYHRKRTFPGHTGRLRSGLAVDNGRTTYESAAGAGHVDLAARYSHSFGPFDVGVSAFDGTSREPFMQPESDAAGTLVLAPHYEQIRQLGVDAQATIDAWLLKLEAIRRTGARNRVGEEEDYSAFVVGGEYTFYSAFDSDVDLGLIGEWLHDGRGRNATDIFQDDLFVALRLAFNDVDGTEVIAGIVEDMDYGSRFLAAELNRRLTDHWSLHLEATALLDVDPADIQYDLRNDSFVELRLVYGF